jgi:hypothetical protein
VTVSTSLPPEQKNTYPRHALPPNAKEHIVQKEERNRSLRPHLLCSIRQRRHLIVPNADGNDAVAEELASCGIHHHLASAPALDIRNADQREEEVRHRVTRSQQTSHVVRKADGYDKDGREVVGRYINTSCYSD